MELIKLDSLKDIALNILPYGEPGCGKTRFVGTVGEKLYTLAVDVDNGFKTLIQLPKSTTDNLVKVRMTEFEDIDLIYKLLLKNDPEEMTKALGVKVEKPFEAVAFDTWTQVGWKTINKKRQEIGKVWEGLTFRDNIQIQDWGAILDFHQMCIEAFTELPITFVCTMHSQFYEDNKSGIVKGVPSINGKFAPEVGKYFDVLGYMYVDLQGKYMMATKTYQRFQAKSRLTLDKTIQDPTFVKMFEALKGDIK